jgi:hypothetical protein
MVTNNHLQQISNYKTSQFRTEVKKTPQPLLSVFICNKYFSFQYETDGVCANFIDHLELGDYSRKFLW